MPEMTADGRETRVPFQLIEVDGPSMVPTLNPGDWMLVQHGARVRPGDVVILRHPLQQDLLVVKRAVERRDGGWWVLGDNPYNTGGDSNVYGVVPEDLVLARVRGRFRPLGRFREEREALGRRQLSLTALVSWTFSAVRPVLADRSLSRRLRAR
ncbi:MULTISPECIES: nickel-type superoxide dismutase maturation protease [unclassified Streptomyces]|uniref:nickel-type superoxide dismutase maturation protease n=1 Tax=unclassified Streptomyces TaxID=2593676 RepID=UPI00111015CC|nr:MULTISPECIES: nickel-type superoxide dismutase maturation protease [unclassified Streptomyces]MCI3933009.1 nickel-type superoxide dismutase maturation protease [Streptomyces sp. AN091965]QCX79048.1 Peptidase S24-like protein [Streptomyces sp. YIM 121038]